MQMVSLQREEHARTEEIEQRLGKGGNGWLERAALTMIFAGSTTSTSSFFFSKSARQLYTKATRKHRSGKGRSTHECSGPAQTRSLGPVIMFSRDSFRFVSRNPHDLLVVREQKDFLFFGWQRSSRGDK
jgi:hypothetical protein